MGTQLREKLVGGGRNFDDRGVEGGFVHPRGGAEPADFSNELESCGRDLRWFKRRFRSAQDFDAAAHNYTLLCW